MIPYFKVYSAVAIATIVMWTTACSSPPPAGTKKPDDPLSVPDFRRLPKAEISKALAGKFIDERPYACDDGPLMFKTDGTFIKADGWGGSSGRYVVHDGEVILKGIPANRVPATSWTKIIRLYRFRDTIYFGGWKIEDILPLQVAPIDNQTIHLSCGD